ncbi:hypothetical protein QOT17_012423 [Balamuthia mandrillaris]
MSAQSLKNKFEDLARPKDPTVEEVKKTTWATSGNSGGGTSGHEGKFNKTEKVIVKKKGPPPKKSLSDLP